MKNKIIWCDRGFFPVYFGFCPNKKAWNKFLKEMTSSDDFELDDWSYPSSDAACTFFTNYKDRPVCVITTQKIFDKEFKKQPEAITSLLVHECMHIWQKILEEMKEEKPSHEFEGWSVQFIFQQIYKAYLDTRIRK